MITKEELVKHVFDAFPLVSFRDQRVGNNQITRPPAHNNGWTQSPRMTSKRGGVSITLSLFPSR